MGTSSYSKIPHSVLNSITDIAINELNLEIYILDNKGHFVWTNKTAAKKIEIAESDLQEKTIFDIDPHYPFESYEKIFNQTISGLKPHFALKHKKKNGSNVYSEIKCFALYEQKYLCGIGRDITENVYLQKNLKRNQDKYRTLFENSGSAMMIIENDRSVSMVNKEFERMTGLSQEEMQNNKTWESLIPSPDDRQVLRKYHKKRRQAKQDAPNSYELEIGTKSGLRTVKVQSKLIPGTMQSVASFMDITDYKHTLGRLETAHRALTVLSACNQAVVLHKKHEQELLETICNILTQLGKYQLAWVGEAGQEGEIRIIAKSGSPAQYIENLSLSWSKNDKWGQGPAGIAIRTGEPSVFNNALNHSSLDPWHNELLQQNFGSILGLPLKISGKTWGVLLIYASETNAFHSDEIDLLQELSYDLAFGVNSLRNSADKEYYRQEQEEALKGTVRITQSIVDRRDPYTAGHQQRVTDLAVAIGRELGLGNNDMEGLYFGGMIHDLGKIAVPIEVLTKPGRISDTEFDLIKAHAKVGYDILKDIKFPWPIADIAHQHHERLDGSGYPQGLKGEEIHFLARIMAVADVVEAMASHRPYRPGLGVDIALQEIEDKAGSHYDPDVVQACVRTFRDKGYQLTQ